MAEAKWTGVLSTTEPRNDVGIIKVRQGNINSEIVEFQIVQNNKPYDLTGLTIYFCASFGLNLVEKPADVVNMTGGIIQYTFDDDSMQAVGRQKGYFSMKKEESKIDSTQEFEYQVESSLMTRSIDGKSHIYRLEDLIKLMEDFIDNGENDFDTWYESVKGTLYGVDPGGNILKELIEARENESGQKFTSLKTRLKSVDEQISQTDLINSLSSFNRYGYLELPDDIPFDLGFNLYRDMAGKVQHNFNFGSLTNGFQTIYVHVQNGNELNNGLSEDKPVRFLKTALDIAKNLPGTTVNIMFLEKIVYYGMYDIGDNNVYTIPKNINFISKHVDGSYIYTGNYPNSFTWALDNGVYRTARTAVDKIYDAKFRDFRGNPRPYTKVDSLTKCTSRRGSWFTDGSQVFVNRLDGSSPSTDNQVLLILPINTAFVFNAENFRVYVDNVHFYIKQNTTGSSALAINGNEKTNIIIRKSSFNFSRRNGLEVKGFNTCFVFDSVAEECGLDGFNYHADSIIDNPSEKVFEYDIYSRGHGYLANENGNATTAHDGMTVVRVGCVGHDTNGPVLADVNGCYSLNIDCNMYDSLRSADKTKAAFYADEAAAVKKGKMYLINCSGGGKETHTVNTDGKIELALNNLKGNKIPESLNFSIID